MSDGWAARDRPGTGGQRWNPDDDVDDPDGDDEDDLDDELDPDDFDDDFEEDDLDDELDPDDFEDGFDADDFGEDDLDDLDDDDLDEDDPEGDDFEDGLDLGDELGSELTGSVDVSCPYCGAGVEMIVDPVGGDVQEYVEDCEVCCQPWSVRVTMDADGSPEVELGTLDEG